MISDQVAAVRPQPSAATVPGPEHSSASTPRGQSPVPAALLLAVVPLVLFGGPAAVSAPPPPLPVKSVQVEGVRVIRMDATTFSGRWRPMYDVPPATVIHEIVGGGDAAARETGKPVDVPAMTRPPARLVKRASLRQDICSRHGMHRVTVVRGKWQGWRCRR